uniref:Uncharacterized protein n=1 Tax=mine drainage metagenome TaxID=410659 RepID=E6QX45_9ZZZZ
MVPGVRIELTTKRYECLVLPLELTGLKAIGSKFGRMKVPNIQRTFHKIGYKINARYALKL